MVTHVSDNTGRPLLLSADVLVEGGGLAAEEVGSSLTVIGVEVSDQAWHHVIVVTARTQAWVAASTGLGVEPSEEAPHWHNNQHEVSSQ